MRERGMGQFGAELETDLHGLFLESFVRVHAYDARGAQVGEGEAYGVEWGRGGEPDGAVC